MCRRVFSLDGGYRAEFVVFIIDSRVDDMSTRVRAVADERCSFERAEIWAAQQVIELFVACRVRLDQAFLVLWPVCLFGTDFEHASEMVLDWFPVGLVEITS